VPRYRYGCGTGKGVVAVVPGRLDNYRLAARGATWRWVDCCHALVFGRRLLVVLVLGWHLCWGCMVCCCPPYWMVGCRLGCPGVPTFLVNGSCSDKWQEGVDSSLDILFNGEESCPMSCYLGGGMTQVPSSC